MLQLNISCKANGIPVMSRGEIEKITQSILKDFNPDMLQVPQKLDIDRFLRSYLEMTCFDEFLSSNALYLGLTAFKDEKIIVFNPRMQRAEFMNVKANTVVIEKTLSENPKELQRKRFTQAHEAGHIVLHRKYYESLNEDNYLRCLGNSIEGLNRNAGSFTDDDWLEWQANKFASAILMPAAMVKEVCLRYQDIGDEDRRCSLQIVVVSTIFDVSEAAAQIRLKSLGIINKDYKPDTVELKYLRQFKSGLRINRNGGK